VNLERAPFRGDAKASSPESRFPDAQLRIQGLALRTIPE
jgi:hypothetical protein